MSNCGQLIKKIRQNKGYTQKDITGKAWEPNLKTKLHARTERE
jgi:hypothetical protein